MGRFSGGLGLAAGLSPATAREALERMDRVQALEAERLRLDEELERQERERDALRMPLREILRQLGRLPDVSANNAAEEPDWPGWLEALLREWESAVPKTPRSRVSAPDPKNRPGKSGRLRPSIMTPCGKWNVSSIWRRCRCRGVLSEARGKAGTGSARAPPRRSGGCPSSGGSGSVWGGCRYSGVFRLVRRGGQRGLGSGARRARGPFVHACG